MKKLRWFERRFTFGLPVGMLPFYLERLAGTQVRLEYKLKSISDEVLSHRAEGKWSIKQNIGHLAEVDEIAQLRIGEIVNGVSPMSSAVFEPKKDYSSQPLESVIQYFVSTRSRTLEEYSALAESDLFKSSLHPRLKVNMTPVDLAWFDAEHDDHHLVTINEIIEKVTA
jgi:DinB superfamily